MSIIVAVAYEDQIIIKSDGREVDSNKNIINDCSPKIIRINDTVIGFTGSTQARSKIVTSLINKFPNLGTTQPQEIYNSAKYFCKMYCQNEVITMTLASTFNNQLFLKAFANNDNSIIEANALDDQLPSPIITGTAPINFESPDILNAESYINNYIKSTSKIVSTVGGEIYTEKLILY